MPEIIKGGDEKAGPGKDKKGGMTTGKNKWYLISGLAAVAMLVFFFVSKSGSNAAAGTSSTTGQTGIDPTTLASLLAAQQSSDVANGAGLGSGGAAGPAGPAGPAGAVGKTGATGPPGKAGPPVKVPPTKPIPKPHVPPVMHPGSAYTVRPGDSLSSIASRFHISGGWQSLYKLNQHTVGGNPNLIHPGQRLTL